MTRPAAPSASVRPLLRKAALGLVLLIAVLTALTLVADAGELVESIRSFDWRWLPLITALTLWNYGWRYVKWERYLKLLGVPPIPRLRNVQIFLAGFAMSITPGKVGELIKALYVRRITGAPVERVSAAVAVERVTDGLAMICLAAVGSLAFDYARPFLLAITVVALLGIAVLQRPTLMTRVMSVVQRIPVVERIADRIEHFLVASAELVRPRPLASATGIGIIAWTGECVAFFLVLVALGIPASGSLLLTATFVLAVSSLAGGASGLPGGLGVTDASVAGMLTALVSHPEMDRTTAVAATLLIRFATLWFAVLIGFGMVLLLHLRLRTERALESASSGVVVGGRR